MPLPEKFTLYLKLLLPIVALALLQISPESHAVRSAQAEARKAQTSGDHRSASAALRRLLEHQPWRVDLWEQAGREAQAAGQLEEAIRAYHAAEQHNLLSAGGRFALGEAYLQQGDELAAEAAWQDSLRIDGPSGRVFERLVQLREQRGDLAGAAGVLRAWREAEPGSARVAYLLGLYLSVVEPGQAAPLLIEAAQKDSAFTPPVQTLRAALSVATNTDQPAFGWLMIGRALGSIGRWDLAVQAFEKSVAEAPGYGEAWAFLGEAYDQQGRGGSAELERARALSPNSVVVNALYSLRLRRQGDHASALAQLRTIAEQEPGEPFWQVEIGRTLVDMGDLPGARAHYEQAVALAPESSPYWQALAQFSILYDMDRQNLGLPAARQAVLLSPQDAAALDTMGLAMLYLEDLASAERFLQRALERNATYAPANLHMGQLLLQQNNFEQARLYLRRAASLAGDDATGLVARRLLRQYYGEAADGGT